MHNTQLATSLRKRLRQAMKDWNQTKNCPQQYLDSQGLVNFASNRFTYSKFHNENRANHTF